MPVQNALLGRTQFKHYLIKQPLGKGGMGEVYLAADLHVRNKIRLLSRRRGSDPDPEEELEEALIELFKRENVALKVLSPKLSSLPHYQDRFAHEVAVHSNLHHPNIVELFDGGVFEECFYLTTEYIEGWNLYSLQQEVGRMPVPLALHVLEEVLKGLQYIHGRNVIHTDIKPANILISRETGAIKIADFGLLKHTELASLSIPGLGFGTLAYSPPEQALGKEVTLQTDIYAAGVLFYEMVSGIQPFHSSTKPLTLEKILRGDCPNIQEVDQTVDYRLEAVIRKMMAPEPSARFQSCEEVLERLKAVQKPITPYNDAHYFRQFCASPAKTAKVVRNSMAGRYLDRIRLKCGTTTCGCGEILLDLRCALAYQPANAVAKILMEELFALTGFHKHLVLTPEIEELELQFLTAPENQKVLKKLAIQHEEAGNFYPAATYYHRYLDIAEQDEDVRARFMDLLRMQRDLCHSPGFSLLCSGAKEEE